MRSGNIVRALCWLVNLKDLKDTGKPDDIAAHNRDKDEAWQYARQAIKLSGIYNDMTTTDKSLGQIAYEEYCDSIDHHDVPWSEVDFPHDWQAIAMSVQPRWIGIADRLPNDMDSVLVLLANQKQKVAVFTKEPAPVWNIDNFSFVYVAQRIVTHWMPLPASDGAFGIQSER